MLFAAAAVKCTVLVLPRNKTAGKKRKMKKGPFSHGPQGCWLVWAKRQKAKSKVMLFKKGEGGCLISHACVVQCEGRRSWRKRLTRNFGPTPSLVSPGAEFFLRPPPATTDGCLEKMKRKG